MQYGFEHKTGYVEKTADSAGQNWYNEAFDGVEVHRFVTYLQVGLVAPAVRTEVIDPKLIPKNDSFTVGGKNNIYDIGDNRLSNYYGSAFRTENEFGANDNTIGNYGDITIETDRFNNLYQSQLFWIAASTTQDKH